MDLVALLVIENGLHRLLAVVFGVVVLERSLSAARVVVIEVPVFLQVITVLTFLVLQGRDVVVVRVVGRVELVDGHIFLIDVRGIPLRGSGAAASDGVALVLLLLGWLLLVEGRELIVVGDLVRLYGRQHHSSVLGALSAGWPLRVLDAVAVAVRID